MTATKNSYEMLKNQVESWDKKLRKHPRTENAFRDFMSTKYSLEKAKDDLEEFLEKYPEFAV